MSTGGPVVRDMTYRNRILEMVGIAQEIDAITLSSNAGTANPDRLAMQVTTEALTTAAAASQALTINHGRAEAGDYVQVTWNGGTSAAGTPVIKAVATAGVITVTLYNKHASAAFDGTFILAIELRKKLTTITRNQ